MIHTGQCTPCTLYSTICIPCAIYMGSNWAPLYSSNLTPLHCSTMNFSAVRGKWGSPTAQKEHWKALRVGSHRGKYIAMATTQILVKKMEKAPNGEAENQGTCPIILFGLNQICSSSKTGLPRNLRIFETALQKTRLLELLKHFLETPISPKKASFIKKIPDTGDTESLNRCRQQHRYHKTKSNP